MPSVANAALLSEPAYLWIPEGATFYTADEVIDFARALGQQVGQPEIDALRTLMAEGPDGQFAGFGSAIICGRQNIKTWAIRMCVLYDAFVRGVPRITFSAHLFKTTRDSFVKIDELVQSFDWMRRAVKRIRYANGEEGFELLNGSVIDFVARSLKGSRGLGGDTVVLDEWLFGTGDMLGALVPTMSTAVKPHILYGSSPGVRTSEALRDVRERGRSMSDPTLTYIEWTTEREGCTDPACSHKAGKSEGCELDREEKWPAANPALGRRISYEYVRKERREIPPIEFMRERMGWWEDPPTSEESSLFPMEQWAERLAPDSTVADDVPLTYAVDTSWDRQTSWISVAGLNAQGVPHVEIVKTGYGQDWVIPWLRPRVTERPPLAIGLQGGNAPVSTLVDKLEKEFGDVVRVLTGVECARACGGFFDAVEKGPLAHIDQEQLDDAMKQGVARPMGEGWLLDRKLSPVDVAGLFSACVALYLLETTEPPAPKRVSVPKRLR